MRPDVYHACQLCDDTGWVSAVERSTKASYAFRCGNCGMADRIRLSRKIPPWSNQLKTIFRLWKEPA